MAAPAQAGSVASKLRRASDGKKALNLLLDQVAWTNRRVETISFEAHGETRSRISWDFTLPHNLAIRVSANRVAVPLSTLRKHSLKRLDVHDASGQSLPVWGRQQNGFLALKVLESGFTGVVNRPVRPRETDAFERIVHAASALQCERDLALISHALRMHGVDPAGHPLIALARDLAENFILVVEMPKSIVGTRTLVKLQYESNVEGRDQSRRTLAPVFHAWLDGAAWSAAASWHLEVHAPTGLALQRLIATRTDDDKTDVEVARSTSLGAIGHISGEAIPAGSLAWAAMEMRPARSGLVTQTLVGATATWLLLVLGNLLRDRIPVVLDDSTRAAAFAAILLVGPAYLIASSARSAEHGLVSGLLVIPRLLNLAVAFVLMTTAASLVLNLSASALQWSLLILLATQTLLTYHAIIVETGSVREPR